MPNPFKVSGPIVNHEIAEVQCCRIWPVVVATLSWEEGIDSWKRESWWWRTCGICREYPRPIDSRAEEGDLYR